MHFLTSTLGIWWALLAPYPSTKNYNVLYPWPNLMKKNDSQYTLALGYIKKQYTCTRMVFSFGEVWGDMGKKLISTSWGNCGHLQSKVLVAWWKMQSNYSLYLISFDLSSTLVTYIISPKDQITFFSFLRLSNAWLNYVRRAIKKTAHHKRKNLNIGRSPQVINMSHNILLYMGFTGYREGYNIAVLMYGGRGLNRLVYMWKKMVMTNEIPGFCYLNLFS